MLELVLNGHTIEYVAVFDKAQNKIINQHKTRNEIIFVYEKFSISLFPSTNFMNFSTVYANFVTAVVSRD